MEQMLAAFKMFLTLKCIGYNCSILFSSDGLPQPCSTDSKIPFYSKPFMYEAVQINSDFFSGQKQICSCTFDMFSVVYCE